jgi:hypothetical protein
MTNEKPLLKFGENNAKLFGIHTFSLPSGWTCPGAKDCLAKAVRKNGKTKLIRGQDAQFTCYQASLESIFPILFNMVHRNWELLKEAKTTEKMGELIHNSLPLNARIIRIHVGGDFYSEAYFRAWILVALNNPNIIFYAYTKSIHIWKRFQNIIPTNFVLTASKGGKFDSYITETMKTNEVVFSPEEAEEKGIPIDHDDSYAYSIGVQRFATLLHGKQAAGSTASQALKDLKKRGMGVYTKNKKGYSPAKAPFRVLELPSLGGVAKAA